MTLNKIGNNNDVMRFHMPGHSGIELGIGSGLDLTELSFSGNLIAGTGEPLELERAAAEIYGAKYALIFTAGATSAVSAAILAVKQIFARPKIRFSGNTHKSAYSYADLFGVPIAEKDDKGCDLVSFRTSPDYFGEFSDISAEEDCKLKIIDASHGAHYPFSARLPKISAEKYDIIIYSLHKTLPVLTGGALIVTDSESLYEQLLLARARTHTSSPSYMTLVSIDKAFDRLKIAAEDYERVYNLISEFIADCPFKAYFKSDFTRLIIDADEYSAESLNDYLEGRGAYVEAVSDNKLVLIVTPYNADKLEDLNNLLKSACRLAPKKATAEYPRILRKSAQNAAKIGTISIIPLENAVGKMAAAEAGLYPPGTPLIKRGDLITEEAVNFLKLNKDRIFGLINGKIAVYSE